MTESHVLGDTFARWAGAVEQQALHRQQSVEHNVDRCMGRSLEPKLKIKPLLDRPRLKLENLRMSKFNKRWAEFLCLVAHQILLDHGYTDAHEILENRGKDETSAVEALFQMGFALSITGCELESCFR